MHSMLSLDYVVNSIFSSVTYVIPCSKGIEYGRDCWLVDCGDVEKVIEKGWNVVGVLLTHVHFDHIYGLNRLLEVMPNAVVYTNADGYNALLDPRLNFSRYHTDAPDFILDRKEAVRIIQAEEVLELQGGLRVNVFFTPGHTPNCISYGIGDCLFTGDAYIPGVKVVTTFPRSNKQEAQQSLERLKDLEEQGLRVKAGHKVLMKDVWANL